MTYLTTKLYGYHKVPFSTFSNTHTVDHTKATIDSKATNHIVLGPSPGELVAAWLEVFLYEMIHCTLIHVVV